MTDHPTPDEIDGLARGTLSRAGRKRLIAHLVRGCARCAGLIAPALALAPPIPESRRRHACGRPGRAGKARDAGDICDAGDPGNHRVPPPPAASCHSPADLDAYDLPVALACAAAVRRFNAIDTERRAGDLLAAGQAEPPPEPSAAVASAADSRRLRGLLRVEMLLAASWDLRYSEPQEMVRIAELALFAAERLDQERYAQPVIADVRARAWAELANAFRVADQLVQAEQAMALSVTWRHRGSGDPWLLARIADLMASLLADQRRFADAGALLSKVHLFYQQAGDHHLAGRALICRGIFAGYDNDPRGALVQLIDGLELIDIEQDWQLAVQAVQAVLWNLVDLGRFRQARIHLWRSRSLLVRHGGQLHLLRLRWLEGRIHAGVGDLDRAERELVATRSGFEAAGSPYNAGLVSLDLAAQWLRQGKTKQVRRLVEEMIDAFRALRIAREAVAALLILREACDRDDAAADGLRSLRAVTVLLTELERQPCRRIGLPSAD